jgi:hypothetical protein
MTCPATYAIIPKVVFDLFRNWHARLLQGGESPRQSKCYTREFHPLKTFTVSHSSDRVVCCNQVPRCSASASLSDSVGATGVELLLCLQQQGITRYIAV